MRHFKIFPDHGRYYFDVHIWPTLSRMRTEANKEANRDCGRFHAISLGYTKQQLRGNWWSDCLVLGSLHFYSEQFRVGIISHECHHALCNYMEAREKRGLRARVKKQGSWVSDQEEIAAWVTGNLNRQVVIGYQNKRQFYSRKKPPFKQLAPK